jgi:hypothetical protein
VDKLIAAGLLMHVKATSRPAIFVAKQILDAISKPAEE